ncbi:hypothetical protein SCORR_v1c05920 [Spiroplasma corruscae]|uniref:AAA+ ATPase domain-containing protein n=1 Tax=Spiroplasma corruscae TaxID=216934 RepID=A0A222EQ09_9MOLU|nr:AAA domain-containing protein [Spiroplasma corruscae]ASP28364.1 hypothetical protein SCORR_v1c05920 [Spiroplasma corruscae]
MIKFKLTNAKFLDNVEEFKIIKTELKQNSFINSKITTKKIIIEKDLKYPDLIKEIKDVEVIIKLSVGLLVLYASLSCDYRTPLGANMFIYKYKVFKNKSYEQTKGFTKSISFNDLEPSSIEELRTLFESLINSKDFVFNISQFSDFMDIFKYYKELYNEINNNDNFVIENVSKKEYFISSTCKELFNNNNELQTIYKDFEPVYDNNEILIGYTIPSSKENINKSIQKDILTLKKIRVKKKTNIYKKITRQKENLFLSNYSEVNSNNINGLVQVELIYIKEDRDSLVLSVSYDKEIDFKYLLLYDKGQQIKIESIENSLKLIEEGNSGTAINLLEYLIGDAKMPNETIYNKINNIELYTKGLNISQTKAFLKGIDSNPITLIKGPPGTGKTHVINSIIQYITKELKERVIISSQTHIAIDNVLDKLVENKDPVIPRRITNKYNRYDLNNIDETLFDTWASKFEEYINDYQNEEIKNNILNDYKKFKGEKKISFTEKLPDDYYVIGATTTTTAISGRKGYQVLENFKWLIIDEVSKCPITEVLRYLPYVEKIILVGDDYQLSPILEFSKDDVKDLKSYDEEKFDLLEKTYIESIFSKTIKKAEESDRLVLLNENYRSTEQILSTYNVFYDNQLKCNRKDKDDKLVAFKEDQEIISNDKDVYFIEPLNGTESSSSNSTSRFNIYENEAIKVMLNYLINNVKNPQEIKISTIFPYKDQLRNFIRDNSKLINKLKIKFRSYEIDTIDAFQGKESDIVLVSTVVTDINKLNFLKDFRRINVALSRAKDKLFLFGNINLKKLVMSAPNSGKNNYLNNIIEYIESKGIKISITPNGEINYDKRDSKFKII